MYRQILVELPRLKFHEIRLIESELMHENCRRDRCGLGNVRNIDRKGGGVMYNSNNRSGHVWRELKMSVIG
jgi:hypothetical protein